MKRCLELAMNGQGTTDPNPMVGAVIVHDNKIIGEGWHQKAGGPHAEVHAINSVVDKSVLKEATIYVSLEPCAHQGKTPPCCDLIIEHNIPNVVIGSVDPNPKVSGMGISKLKAAGIEVVTGVLESNCLELNKRFFTFHQKKRPFITLKWAKSKDGFLDKKRKNGERGSFGISGAQTRVFVHKLRTEHDAILIGPGTAYNDDPQLSSRWFEGKSPVRLVLDRFAKLPDSLILFSDDFDTWHYSTKGKPSDLGNKHKIIIQETGFIQNVLDHCAKNGIQSILVEGGRTILQQFLELELWDEIIEIKSQKVLKEGLEAPFVSHSILHVEKLGKDELSIYRNVVSAS